MYEQFFGLRERPFDLVPDPRFLFLSDAHREARAHLRYGLVTLRGLTLLTGPAGTGKTTMLTAVLAEADARAFRSVVVSSPTLTRDEFYETLALGFGLDDGALRSRPAFLMALRKQLEAARDQDVLTALVLDEAQNLSDELLEEVHLLSNLESATSRLLAVILIGRPDLATRLNDPALQHIKQRVALRCELRPLTLSEVGAYVATRLTVAGGSPLEVFTREAVRAVHAGSRGIPRTVNVICDNALLGGFAAGERPVREQIVAEVCGDFQLAPVGPPAPAAASRPSLSAPANATGTVS